ncbi:MAG: porphobilinogen synthase [Rickettsiales bacterium]|nr:porphobilinogen synthase [Rickettsiales bacterium]
MHLGAFPHVRMRRNRKSAWSRNLVAENRLSVHDLILPMFVQEGENTVSDVGSMPGVQRFSVDLLVKEARRAAHLGICAVALFPVVTQDKKTELAEESYHPDNLMCRAIRAIKKEVPYLGVIGDVALDPYTSHGQDGLVIHSEVANDETIDVLIRQALSLAAAGCDIVAPSDMMDGRIGAIRQALDAAGYPLVQILAYAAKYASSFYGPFRDAVGSASNLGTGNKYSYQMNPANGEEAIREVALDIEEGADMVMVKPGMPYLDVVRHVSEHFSVPVFAYQVSGEYAMLKAAETLGWLDYKRAMMEAMISFKRAGATGIFTYAAIEVAEWLLEHSTKHTPLMESR